MHEIKLQQGAVLLHRELLDSLLLNCQQSGQELSQKFAAAVYLSEDYMKRLYELMPEHFAETCQEILFFKSIKPLFVAEREYHQRQYHASLFATDNHFWEHELKKMEGLLKSNIGFRDYYRNGETYNDHAWFTQGLAPLPTELCMSPWETNPKHTSARDGWAGGLLAVERYRDWLQAKQIHLKNQLI